MNAIVFMSMVLFFWNYSPDKMVDMDHLVILHDSSADTDIYYYTNLDALWNMSGRSTLALKVATCDLSHPAGTTDLEPATPGMQHSVAVAINGGGSVIATKAALPCPPHCSGGKYEMSFADFMSIH